MRISGMRVRVVVAALTAIPVGAFMACGTSGTDAKTLDSQRDRVLSEGVLRLKSETGVEISVDWTKRYLDQSSNKPLNYTVLSKLAFNVRPADGQSFDEGSKIRVVVVQKMFKNVGCGGLESDSEYEVPYELDLVRQGDGTYKASMFESGFMFTGGVSGELVKRKADRINLNIDAYCEYHASRGTQMSVVIDGQWQKDPINQTNNFVLSF